MAKQTVLTSYDPRVDAAIAAASAFAQPILQHLRAAVHEAVPDITEDIKWGRPFFILHGEILGNMAAFSRHCAFGFWSAKMTAELTADGIDGAGSSGSLGKIASLDDLPPKRQLLLYLKQAAAMMREGTYGPGPIASRAEGRSVKAPLALPADLAAALARNKAAKAAFDAFPPSARREYIEWVVSAKREETRSRRVAEAVAKVAEGKRHNEKYR